MRPIIVDKMKQIFVQLLLLLSLGAWAQSEPTKVVVFDIKEEAGGGLVFWYPKGYLLRETIENYWKDLHRRNGYEVIMVEKNPSIGGTMAQLDKTFPTMDCSI